MPGAVFFSYASQDAEAAKRICEALRATGVVVWFDESEPVNIVKPYFTNRPTKC